MRSIAPTTTSSRDRLNRRRPAGSGRAANERMSTDANKRIVQRFVDDVLAAGRVEAIDEIVAPDFVSHTWDMTDAGRE